VPIHKFKIQKTELKKIVKLTNTTSSAAFLYVCCSAITCESDKHYFGSIKNTNLSEEMGGNKLDLVISSFSEIYAYKKCHLLDKHRYIHIYRYEVCNNFSSFGNKLHNIFFLYTMNLLTNKTLQNWCF